ncbi:MAG: hypothetical protein R3B40_27850 [Polyangiales bacterium]|nr:hypothetical protein [Myxococcales bacterium]
MRRLIVESEASRQVDAPLPDVRALLSDFPRAMRLLPMVGLVQALPADDAAYVAGRERFRVHLGPFGVGGFRGTLRLVVDVAREATEDRYALQVTTVAGEGNTDASIDFVARGVLGGTNVHCHVWAAPRKDIPAMLPLGIVRRAASRVLEAALSEGLEGLWRQVCVDELEYEPTEGPVPS